MNAFTYTICYKCTFRRIGYKQVSLAEKITIVAEGLDCSTALTDNNFVAPTVYYDSVLTPKTIVPDYTTIFTHTK